MSVWPTALRIVLPIVVALCGRAWPALAQGDDGAACAAPIAAAERADRLPPLLLTAISLVESGRPDPRTGRAVAWPWTITAGGIGHYYPSRDAAVAAAQALLDAGVRSIDVGCMQVNLAYHPAAFASLDAAFDPVANVTYGARFLGALHRQTGSWPRAAAAYHSQTPEIGRGYESRVMAIWPLAGRYPDADLAAGPGEAADIDYAKLTPAFAAQVRGIVADRERLRARFGPAAPIAARPPRRHEREALEAVRPVG